MECLLDTNFLMVPAQFKVDIFSELGEYELVTLDRCMTELEKISKGKGRDAAAAKIAMKMAKGRVRIARAEGRGTDTAIVNYAKKKKCAVATNDQNLMKTLKKYGIKIIRLRQKKYLTER